MEIITNILAACGAISVVGGAVAVLWKWIRPAIMLKSRVDKLEENVEKDYTSINEVKQMQGAMCQALIAIIDHDITGNHVEGLKKTKNDLIKLITEH